MAAKGSHHTFSSEENDRYSRQELIPSWDQSRLLPAKILVVGAGALGNEILKNLALVGIGNIFIVDSDVIESSNLSRTILFRECDIGKSKAEVAARSVKDINPEVNVQYWHGNVNDLGAGVFGWADLAIAGVDNREARLVIDRNCQKTGTPWIDGGIEGLNGIVRVFVPPYGVSYEDTMGKIDWEILQARRSCNGLTRDDILLGKVPTVATSASVIGGIQAQEAIKLIHGSEVLKSKGFVFDGLTHRSYVVNYSRKEDVGAVEPYSAIEKLDKSVMDTTLLEALEDVKKRLGTDAVIELNREIVHKFICTACGTEETVLKSSNKVTERDSLCPFCTCLRDVSIFHSINGSETFLDKTFAEIGIPPLDIIVGREGMHEVFLEFSKDATAVLGSLFQNDQP